MKIPKEKTVRVTAIPVNPKEVYNYDDPDDFADDWAEEFGGGNYDGGYNAAYDYWEENYGK